MRRFTHAATLVAQKSTADLLDRAENVLRQAGIEQAESTRLSANGDLDAWDLRFTPKHPEDLINARQALQTEISSISDFAVTAMQSRRKRLLISDMDSTIIEQECLDELADFAGLKTEISAITERAMRGELNFDSALTARVSMLRGLDMSALERCYRERITLTPGAKNLVETMAAHGARCILVSGGFTYFTSRVAKAAGFHADRGNTLLHDSDKLTGEVGTPILGREAKLDALKEESGKIDASPEDALAIGDGANDLAMIKAAGLGLAFRAKPVVAAEAHAAINITDLRAALYFQGYSENEFTG